MQHVILRRLLLAVPTFLLASVVIFFAIRLVPGDQLTLLIGERVVEEADRAALKAQLGLDKPLPVQYWDFISGVFRGDLGTATFDKQPVVKKIFARLPVTFELAMLAIVISIIIAIPVGVISALKRNTPLDYLLRLLAILGLSIPSFWLATVTILILALWIGWSPPLRYTSFIDDPIANLKQFLLPSVILGTILAASTMRMTRSMMLEVLRQDYIRTAKAKGLRERIIMLRHALKNALIPVVTVLGLQVAQVVGGSVVLESIFALPGMGRLLIDALNNRDYPVVQAINVIVVVWVILVNLLVDLSYVFLDPRSRYG